MNEGVHFNNVKADALATLDLRVRRYLEALARIHGKVSVRQETGGLHAYFPSPIRLPIDGRKELVAMHGAINLDKYFGTGKWGNRHDYDNDDCAMCMKSGKKISAMELLDYPPIQERGIPEASSQIYVTSVDNEEKRITDALGRRVPGPPGDCTPLIQLPPEHPAVQYVVERGFDLKVLNIMLEAAFCHRELPEGTLKRFYRRGPDGWRDTPQNRLVLFGRQEGSHVGWQARLLQAEKDNVTYYLHPYTNLWVPVEREVKNPDGSLFKEVRADYGDAWKTIARYRSADAMERNSVLFCIDAAIWWNQMMAQRFPNWVFHVVVCEGPLDAAKFGPPAVGMTGKFLSPIQIRLLATWFRRATSLMDNDKGGAEAEEYFKETARVMQSNHARPPGHRKDTGACTAQEIAALRQQILGVSELFI